MAFTRKFLKSLGLNEDQVESVIEAHTEVTDAQKTTIADLTEKANKVDDLQKQLDAVSTGEDWQKKYNDKDKELKDYKAEVESKERETALKAAFRELLVEEHVGERQLDAVVRATDFKDMKLGADGKLENVDTLRANIKRDWAGFITTTTQQGAPVANPPTPNPAGGANPRAAEIAKKFHEQRYGRTPTPQPQPTPTPTT